MSLSADIDRDFDVLDDDDGTESDANDENKVVEVSALDRDEIFSRKYRPTQAESTTLQEIGTQLGLIAKQSSFLKSSSSLLASFRGSINKDIKKAAPSDDWLEFAENCVLVHRSQGEVVVSDDKRVPCELLVLNRGLAIVPTSNNPPILIPWAELQQIRAEASDCSIQTKTEKSYTVYYSDDPGSVPSLSHILETCVWRYHEQEQWECGWQYRFVYKRGFTEAVEDKVVTMSDEASISTIPDEFQGYTPLHYAVKCRSIDAARSLVKLQSVDAVDSNNHTALYWAVREEYSEIADLLRENGAKSVATDRGELFQHVEQVTQDMEQYKQEAEVQKQAELEARSEMQNNLQLIQERGEKIAQMGETATALQDGATDYAKQAKQLKATLQQRNNRWGLF